MNNAAITELVAKVSTILLDPAISLVFAVSFMVFMAGIAEFIYNLNIGSGDTKKGKLHIMYGLLGMFIMTAAWTIMKIIDATIGSNIIIQ